MQTAIKADTTERDTQPCRRRSSWPPRCPRASPADAHEETAHRMDRRDDAELPEPWNVGRIDRLDVLEPVTAAASGHRVHGRGALEAVERHPDGAVAQRVHHDLPAPPVHHLRDAPVIF